MPHEFCFEFPPLRHQRAQGMPGVQRARSLACEIKTKHTSIVTTVTPERPGIPRAMVLRLTSRSPRRSGLLSPSSARLLADSTPASGRQNHTTSPSASARFVKRTARVHRIPPHVRDVRTPLCWDGTVRISELIWVRWQAKFRKFGNWSQGEAGIVAGWTSETSSGS